LITCDRSEPGLRKCALPLTLFHPCLDDKPHRQLEKEANEKLSDVYQKLLQAGVDRNESEKEAKLKDTLSNLQRIFPGLHICFTLLENSLTVQFRCSWSSR
jgi:hypothetical protein